MTADLAELLTEASVEVDRPPETGELRKAASRGRRNRRLAGTAVLVAIAGAVGLFLTSLRQSDTVQLDTIDSVDEADQIPTPTPTSTPEPGPDGDGGAVGSGSILVPAGWELDGIMSTGISPSVRPLYIETPEGPLGPLAQVTVNLGLDTLDYADGPTTHRDVSSPTGRIVRIGYDDNPENLTAIFRIDGGSIAIGAVGIPEDELLAITDAIIGATDSGVELDDGALPDPYRFVRPTTDIGPRITISYTLRAGPETTLEVNSQDREDGEYAATMMFRHRPGIVETTIGGNTVWLVPGYRQANWPGALVLTDDRVHIFEAPPWAADSEPMAINELRAIVEALEPVAFEDLPKNRLDIEDRATLLDRWIGDVGLPNGTDLAWLYEGPPMAVDEAQNVAMVLYCAWVLDWVETGNPEAIAVLDESPDHLVITDVVDQMTSFEAPPDLIEYLAGQWRSYAVDMRTATNETERRSTDAFGQCSWLDPVTTGSG